MCTEGPRVVEKVEGVVVAYKVPLVTVPEQWTELKSPKKVTHSSHMTPEIAKCFRQSLFNGHYITQWLHSPVSFESAEGSIWSRNRREGKNMQVQEPWP